MRILEVRDGFIKFETEEKISLSSFLQINDTAKSYIAQVIQVKRTEDKILAFAKILFSYDGTLKNYDKSIPSKNAEITEFTFDIMSKSLEYTIPIIAGKFIDGSIDIPMDKTCFDKKMLISVDSPKSNNRIISNLTKQFSYLGKVLIIDMLGVIEGQKYVAGVDFKLPLNTESLEFMYEDCLNDATAESKSLIKEIFNDLSEYSKTVPFLPFGALKSIVDDMVDKQHVFKLLVLKNKLAKFAQQGYFAATAAEAQNLNKILEENTVVIDLSKLDTTFQNRYLDTIYSFLNNETQVFLEASNLLNKKNIKSILGNESVPTVFVTHSKFKYINEIKSIFDNFIIEPSFTNNETFKIYATFLNSMPKDTYLLVGEGTNYIPFVSSLDAVINIPQPVIEQEEIIEEEEEVSINEEDLDIEKNLEIIEEPVQEEIIEEPITPEIVTEEEEIIEEEEKVEEEPVIEISEEEAAEVIEQKADELINKMSEEVSNIDSEDTSSLFEEEAEELQIEEENSEGLAFETELELSLEDEEEETPAIIEEQTEEIEELPTEPVESFDDNFHTEVDEIQTIEIPEDISDLTDEIEIEAAAEEEVPDSFAERMNIDSDSIGFKDYTDEDILEEPEEDMSVIPLEEDDSSFDAIVELDESEIGEDTILVDFEDEEETDEPLSEEDLDKQIVQDVDKVFTTMKEDTISDSDLDFIDELNNEETVEELEEISLEGSIEELPESFEEEQDEDGFLEPLEEQNEIALEEDDEEEEILETKNTKTPIVPVYEADIPQEDMVMSDPIEQGDLVVHAKYGTGTVEKMIKYGTKTLFSINFDNVGRRLLDPTLTEIKKA
ncbi:MAG: hypothetical protein NC408_05745 [Candidatus Gastranaerophilales bacterium]|nr:hypothetical protein [Candidatus Gastranaerophilales bacterium]MCM1073757.1 hypothetical protein [Bacteroides sp.]